MLKVVFLSLVALATCFPAEQPKDNKSVKDAFGTKPEDAPKTLKEALKRMEAVDIDKILNNERILNMYIQCFLNKGPCTAEAKNIKKFIGQMVENTCLECDEKQRKMIKKGLMHVKTKKPKEYQELVKLYDPKNIRAKELEKFLSNNK